VTVANTGFVRKYMGHMETGAISITDPAMADKNENRVNGDVHVELPT